MTIYEIFTFLTTEIELENFRGYYKQVNNLCEQRYMLKYLIYKE